MRSESGYGLWQNAPAPLRQFIYGCYVDNGGPLYGKIGPVIWGCNIKQRFIHDSNHRTLAVWQSARIQRPPSKFATNVPHVLGSNAIITVAVRSFTTVTAAEVIASMPNSRRPVAPNITIECMFQKLVVGKRFFA